MGNHLTAITINNIAKLKEPRNTYLDILIFDEHEVKEKIDHSKPLFRVFITRLEPKQKCFLNAQKERCALESFDFDEVLLMEKFLYDLSDIDRAMCLAVGRYHHNHFRPFIHDNEVDMDPFVSREHGLIFVNEKRQICYHDIGTFKKGSTNGTKWNDISIVKNEIMYWDAEAYFGLGESVQIIKEKERTRESLFKLRFQEL